MKSNRKQMRKCVGYEPNENGPFIINPQSTLRFVSLQDSDYK